jgi:pimeloyl-ACP methyl ester carboxylesterase
MGCRVFLYFLILVFCSQVLAKNKSKKPIIIVPGLLGSELVNRDTGEKVWFKLSRSEDDDLRLPVSPNLAENRDNLVPTDVVRRVKVGLLREKKVYESLIQTLKEYGYVESSWEKPMSENCFYLFAYDWRRDNIENAKILIEKIEAVKRKLNQPNLKFNVIAHSMGGLIARYAVMYGLAEPPSVEAPIRPTWAGAKHFDKIFLLGTPNRGSMRSLRAFLKGFSVFGINLNLPFIQNLTAFDLFTIPSLYQLLPSGKNLKIYDENLKPMKIDIYNPQVWEDFGWSVFGEKEVPEKFRLDALVARQYVASALKRAEQFHKALRAADLEKAPVKFYLIGSNCKQTLDAVVLYKDKKGWKALFEEKSSQKQNGEKVPEKIVKKLLYSPGDGVVSEESFLGENDKSPTKKARVYLQCEDHDRLMSNRNIQNYILRQISTI